MNNAAEPAAAVPPERPLRPALRLVAMLVAFGLLALAGPGFLEPDGTPALAVLGLALWAASAARPGRFAFPIEWFAASLGFAVQLEWIRHVAPASLVPTGIGMGLYAALAGPLLRRLVQRGVVFPLAAAAAWTSAEALRAWYPPPIGHGWIQLGHLAGAWPEFLGGARVFGVLGLSFALASLGGLAAAMARLNERRRRGELDDGVPVWRHMLAPSVLGIAPFLLTFVFGALTSPPPAEVGPKLLLVQANVPQSRKMAPGSARELLDSQLRSTERGLARLAERGDTPPDLVAWAETMLPLDTVDDAARRGIAEGVPFAPWSRPGLEPADLLDSDRIEAAVVHGELFGRGARYRGEGLLPEGTSFFAGLEVWTERDGELRRLNAVALWPADATADRTVAAKRFLVPGAEALMGLERYAWVRRWIAPVAGYVPDFVPAAEPGRLPLVGASGATWTMGTSVCFDNAFLPSFLDVGDVDFHLVASNEAWYLTAWELDQMVAFSRLAAVVTGRAVARVTNSGITCLIGSDGRDLARLRVEGRDRLVEGALAVDVPVPVRGPDGTAPRPPAAALAPALRWFFLLLGPLLLLGRRWARPGGFGADRRNRGPEVG